ncbi:uncharacterized protein LOC129962974 [Argiope bruennichi]|uniref:uncharacterized protein LOC129962974 n=1 Tax=Argiope bruennichi TaxID=94029 RepID=UPI0024958BEA|nr:uncharacterized protein LOC129962974 [Argiope bruennichi]
MAPPKKGPFSGHHHKVQIQSTEKYFDHFFTVHRISDENETLNTVSPFLVDKAFLSTVGEVTNIRKLRSGDLLVEVSSRQQSQKIMKLKALATIPISVSPHKSLNSSKGVITCGELFIVPVEIITKELKFQGVTHVRQITIRRDGQLLNTKHYVLTFNSPQLPESIKAGYINLPVRPYIPNPLRCFQCQRYGHSKMNCRGTLTCARCAQKGHDGQQCSAPEKCINCNGDHTAYSRLCPRWQLEKKIVAVKFKENISYPEARRKIIAQTPTEGSSYASAVQRNPPTVVNQNVQIEKTKLSIQAQSSNSECDLNDIPEPSNARRRKSKSKSQTSLALRLSKRGLTKHDLPIKLKNLQLKTLSL